MFFFFQFSPLNKSFLFIFLFFACVSFHFLKVPLHSGRSKVTWRTVGRDADQPTKVFEFVKLILRP